VPQSFGGRTYKPTFFVTWLHAVRTRIQPLRLKQYVALGVVCMEAPVGKSDMSDIRNLAKATSKDSRIKILLLEDNPGDVVLFESTIANSEITAAGTGEEALRLLLGGFTPHVVVLDINVPLRTGFEVLSEIKTHPRLRVIPVVMFSVSDRPEDVQQAYKLGAAAYIVKPMELEATEAALSAFANFWTSRVLFPAVKSEPSRVKEPA